ncbi:MAG: coenzyme F420-0:L-glutamate ligase [Methanomicrobiales archaeon]|nr:coenzyme F420-0:L-glutamate ligase [Methanomicrobiales archaeon]
MTATFTVTGLKTPIIRQGDDLISALIDAGNAIGGFRDGDVLVVAENAVATAEGSVVALRDVTPSPRACDLAAIYDMDPRAVEVVLQQSDCVVGGISGFLLCLTNGTLLPNAGVDASNAPPGCLVLLPKNPDASAEGIRIAILERTGRALAVIIADSRTHAMRLGCSGVAIGCSGIEAVHDERGRADLFGKRLEVTKQAVADNIASAAELVMGEADECMPAAVIRGLGLGITDAKGVESIEPSACLFMGVALNANPSLFHRK